ncbi:MAG: hypothetical protein KIT18_02380 [Burkholderiales bacterium]|nr:hypothetical protein [Burkholderiales bacterium]
MSFGQFLMILRVRLGLILMITFTAVAATAAMTMMMSKRYEAATSVILESHAADVMAGSAGPQPATERIENLVSTQLDLIASPAVALNVVDALKLESNPGARELLIGSGPAGKFRELLGDALAWMSSVLSVEGKTPAEEMSKDWLAEQLLRNLRLKANRDSRLIRIGYVSPDPAFAAAAANAFVRAYMETGVQLRTAPAKQSSQWFDEQVRELKRSLEQAEAKLAKFQQEKGIVATDERLDVENGRLNEISAQLAMAQSQSYEERARQRQLHEFLNRGGGEPPVEVATSPVVQQLKQSVADREAKLAEMSRRAGPNHPQYRAAQTELEQLRGQLNEQLRTVTRSQLASSGVASQREGALRAALEDQRRRVLMLKGDRNELAILARDVDNAQRAYNATVQRLTQARMESEVDLPSARVVDSAAVPLRPAGPNTTMSLVFAAVTGLALGIGAALFCETVNRYVRSERDIVEILGIPVLAVLNHKAGARRNVRYLRGPGIYPSSGN